MPTNAPAIFCARLVVLAAILSTTLARLGAAEPYVWIEGEAPSRSNVTVARSGWGHTEFLSGGKWLNYQIKADAADALAAVPADGALFAYDFDIAEAGGYDLWDHHGFESLRTPYQWRVDDGAWTTIDRSTPCCDLTRIEFWVEVAWLKLGHAELAAGKHTLQLRAPATEDEQKKARGIAFTVDALCIIKGAFMPCNRFKPDEEWRQDIDRRAQEQVFELPAPAAGERAAVSLAGTWQIARADEQQVVDRIEGFKALPPADACRWLGIAVPGNKSARLDLQLCHRMVYRTRVRAPAGHDGSAYVLRFPCNSLITTVFVNGSACGSTRVPFAPWECDISAAMKPGQVNEICVGLKDGYYAWKEPNIIDAFFIPAEHMYAQWNTTHIDFPIAYKSAESGMLLAPELMVSGQAYVADAFAIPSVRDQRLALRLTIANPGAAALALTIENEIVPLAGGAPAKTFAPLPAAVPAGGRLEITAAEGWTDARLWWPDDPQQYLAVTRVKLGGTVLDTCRTKFGFREWTWDGPQFTLNGVPWHGRGNFDNANEFTAVAQVVDYKRSGRNHLRLWGDNRLVTEPILDLLDAGGLPARWTGIMDGEGGAYGIGGNAALGEHWIEQCAAWVKATRNHPSIYIWSIENEITYINARNWGVLDSWEPYAKKCWEALHAIDPTRPVMVDGGRALRDQSLPVYGCHYEDSDRLGSFPDDAYTRDVMYHKPLTAWDPWPIAKDKPIFMGESWFVRGEPPSWYAGLCGERAFLGYADAMPGVVKSLKILSEGDRWNGITFTFWTGGDMTAGAENSWSEVALLCRQWNWTFAAGSAVARDLRVFNDTRFSDPITARWELRVDGQAVAQESKLCAIPAGTDLAWPVTLRIPTIPTGVSARQAAELVLSCSRGDKEVFREVKTIAIIDPEQDARPALKPSELLVLDPQGAVAKRLAKRGIGFTAVSSFDALPESAAVVVVGADALTPRQATDPKWQALAANGARVLVLDQATPLQNLALPADLEPSALTGCFAFAENLDHPVMRGLEQQDFATWSADHQVYRNVYKKASRGAVSLVQCDNALDYSALALCPVDDGAIIPCQLLVGSKLSSDPVAQRLFDNLLVFAATYTPVRKKTAGLMAAGSAIDQLLDKANLVHDAGVDLAKAFAGGYGVVIAPADPPTLQRLAAEKERVHAFAQRGGYLMLCGLTQEGLASYNELIGYAHLLRPFEMERVTLPAVRDPLVAGLTMRDVVMDTGKNITDWSSERFASDDVFTSVVDVDEIAPFATIPGGKHWGYDDAAPGFDHWPRNMFNGFTFADSWKYCFTIPIDRSPTSTKWPMTFAAPRTFTELQIQFTPIFSQPLKLNLYFDADPVPVSFTVGKDWKTAKQVFTLPQPREAKVVTIEIADLLRSPDGNTILGIDNMWLYARRPAVPGRVIKPLLNIGALVKYEIGQGGIVLNNLRLAETEANPVNAQKKRTIVATLLRNLGATFSGSHAVVAGAGLAYAPIELGEKCTGHLTRERGWTDERDLSLLPKGEVTLTGVSYLIRDFKTSPLPSCVMLAGPGSQPNLPEAVAGIPVKRRADALYFLHTAQVFAPWQPPKDGDQTPPTVFQYLVHYADGESVAIPIRYGEGIASYISADPRGLRQAAVAWAAPFFGAAAAEQAVVYQFQWANPRPEVEIDSIDVTYAEKANHLIPVVLAITAATAKR